MEREEFLKHCAKAVEQYGYKVTEMTARTIGGLLYELRDLNVDAIYDKDGIADSVAETYVCLMLLQIYMGIPSEDLDTRIEKLLTMKE